MPGAVLKRQLACRFTLGSLQADFGRHRSLVQSVSCWDIVIHVYMNHCVANFCTHSQNSACPHHTGAMRVAALTPVAVLVAALFVSFSHPPFPCFPAGEGQGRRRLRAPPLGFRLAYGLACSLLDFVGTYSPRTTGLPIVHARRACRRGGGSVPFLHQGDEGWWTVSYPLI